MQMKSHRAQSAVLALVVLFFSLAPRAAAQNVTYKPYIQPGDNGPFGAKDQMVIAWQTDEASPSPSAFTVQFGKTASYGQSVMPQGRVVDNYLSADPALPIPPTASGPHSNYAAVLKGLDYDTTYSYRVNGPGMPAASLPVSTPARAMTNFHSWFKEMKGSFLPRPIRILCGSPTSRPASSI